jgi:hypothetical protein
MVMDSSSKTRYPTAAHESEKEQWSGGHLASFMPLLWAGCKHMIGLRLGETGYGPVGLRPAKFALEFANLAAGMAGWNTDDVSHFF